MIERAALRCKRETAAEEEREKGRKVREGRKLSASVICDDERCGERRVLLGGVTKFHERVSPLRPASARECDEKKRSLVRARGRETDRNVLGSPLLAARVIRREKERERETHTKGRQSEPERKTERETYRLRGKKTEAVRRSEKNTERPDPPVAARFVRNRVLFARARETGAAAGTKEEKRRFGVHKRSQREKKKRKKERNK